MAPSSSRRTAVAVLSLALVLGGFGWHAASPPPTSREALAVEPIAASDWWWAWLTTTTRPPVTTSTTRPAITTTTTRPAITTTTTRPAITTTTTRPTTTTTTVTSGAGSVSPSMAAEMLGMINAKRGSGTTCGGTAYPRVPALTLHDLIGRAAGAHAADMATHDYFSHTGRNGSTAGSRLTAAGYRWRAVAENIAAGQPTASSVITAWFGSAGHCANFMSPVVTQIGFGRATNAASRYGTYWVADLARPA